MGKASSSKKVARAARAGGRTTSGPKRQLGYPIAIVAILVVGVLVVVLARGTNQEAAAVSPTIGEHWHASYGIYVCDAFLEPLTDQVDDTTGLHTHGDGLVHIHPFNSGAAGTNATFSKWGETTGIEFSSDGFTVGGTTYDDGYDCGGEPAVVSAYVWQADDTSAAPTVIPADQIGDFHFDQDRLAITLAVVPEGTEVPPPTTVGDLDRLDPVTDEVIPEGSTTTVAADPAAESTEPSGSTGETSTTEGGE